MSATRWALGIAAVCAIAYGAHHFLEMTTVVEETVSEPASPEDAAARKAYFQHLVRLGAINPCKAAFPERAPSFDVSYAAWLKENSKLIKRGEDSVRAVAGPDFDKKPFDVHGAEKQITQLLAGLPAEKRLPWCQQYF